MEVRVVANEVSKDETTLEQDGSLTEYTGHPGKKRGRGKGTWPEWLSLVREHWRARV